MKLLLKPIVIVIAVVLLMPQFLHAQKDTVRVYDQAHPLIYEDAIDLYPYSFLDNDRRTGYNVELVRLLLEKLNIPHSIRLKERREVLKDIKEGKADLTTGMDALFHDEYGYYGKAIIQLFTHSVVTPKNKPVRIQRLEDLQNQRVIVHTNSFSHHIMMNRGWGDNAIPYDDMVQALQDVNEMGDGQVIWNTASLKWIINQNGFKNLQITPVDMMHGEYKFISHDPQLLRQLDSVFIEVNSTGMLDDLQKRWMHPEYSETGIPSWIWWLAALIGIGALVLIYHTVSFRLQKSHMVKIAERNKKRLSLILMSSHVQIWTYDLTTQMFTWMDKNGEPERQYTGLEFARRYHPEDFRRIGEGIRELASGLKKEISLDIRANEKIDGVEQEREYTMVLSILHHEGGKPKVIIGTKIDVTEERIRQNNIKNRMQRYQSIFETAMVDMVFFDADGNVADMNERAKYTFKTTLENAIEHQANVTNCMENDGFELGGEFYATQIGGNKYGIEYYERQLVPIQTADGRMLGTFGSGRDVSEVVTTYHKLQEGITKLRESNKEVSDYVDNINYVLNASGVRIAEYSPDNHTMIIYRALNEVQLKLTQTRCMTLVDDKSKKTAMRMLNNMDNRVNSIIDMQVKTTLRLHGMSFYIRLRFVPITDESGKVVNYYGMCRDISEVRNTQRLLEIETAHAQEVEDLKNSFLRNMSYEIRTPLTSVVGFADLLEQEHNPDDEPLFIEEIKSNSAYLLRLINDILFLSRLDAHMIEINKQPIDFAQTFEGHCQIGWGNNMKPTVNYIVENPYEQLIVDIDDTNMGRIIEQITANAAQYTKQGTVRARYDYVGGKLMIAIDDTGVGMSAETLSHIYERFSSGNHEGTGLGLPICKQLAEQMGGTIELSSEVGKGTTVWITMPCTAIKFDRKNQL